jgi:hypothetical protein
MKYFNTEVRNGQLVLDKQKFRNSVKFTPEGHYLLLLIRMENDRTEREWQKWYRVLLKEMSFDTGHSPNEMHEFAKAEVLSTMELSSTTQLGPIEWREYIERLGDWALDKFDFVI